MLRTMLQDKINSYSEIKRSSRMSKHTEGVSDTPRMDDAMFVGMDVGMSGPPSEEEYNRVAECGMQLEREKAVLTAALFTMRDAFANYAVTPAHEAALRETAKALAPGGRK